MSVNTPLISVGNVVMGGAGKTPVTIALCGVLKKMLYKPVILSKGYGGKLRGPVWVDLGAHCAQDVGDEALLLAKHAPVLVAHNLKAAMSFVPPQKNLVFIMDDGHQQRALKAHLNLLVVDAIQGFGNGRIFPGGPLREPLYKSFKRAQAFCAIGGASQDTWHSLPVIQICTTFTSRLKPDTNVWGVTGLGYPQKFKRTLESLGFCIKGFTAFPDHYLYKLRDIKHLESVAQQANARLVTTEKDWMRWPVGAFIPERVDLNASFGCEKKLVALLKQTLESVHKKAT